LDREIVGLTPSLHDGSTGNLKKEYVYRGATLVTIEPTAVNSNGTQYTTSDNLGSPRVITNSSASVVGRHDYMPFGEDLGAGTGGRTTGMGFSNSGDNNRKKFTGYERDAESGLDFAEARYYANAQGRFTSPDPFSASAIIADPQTFNRYAYCRNNPVNSVDPSGMSAHAPTPASIGAAEREQAEEAGHAVIEEEEARYEEYVHDAELGLLNNTSVTVMISEDPTKDDSSAADDSNGAAPQKAPSTPTSVTVKALEPTTYVNQKLPDGTFFTGVGSRYSFRNRPSP
jgi:RHS repeat-associated protein